MNAVLEFKAAVTIIWFATVAECISAGCTGGQTFLFAAHLVAVRASLQTGAISTPPARIIIAFSPLAVGLLATNTTRHRFTAFAFPHRQLFFDVVGEILAVTAHCRVAYIADMHLRFPCFEAVRAASAGLLQVMASCCMEESDQYIRLSMGQWELLRAVMMAYENTTALLHLHTHNKWWNRQSRTSFRRF